MTITDESRYRLHQRLEQLLGPDEAATLMEHLPPVGWADVATRHDLRREAGTLRREMTSEFAAVRQEMTSGFAAVRQEMTSGFVAVRLEMASQGNALRAELQRDLRLQLLAIMGFNSALVAATYAVARLA